MQHNAKAVDESQKGKYCSDDLLDSGLFITDWKVPTATVRAWIKACTGKAPVVAVSRNSDGWSIYCDTHKCFDYHRDELGGKATILRYAYIDIAQNHSLLREND